jgi:hypothetical protein
METRRCEEKSDEDVDETWSRVELTLTACTSNILPGTS